MPWLKASYNYTNLAGEEATVDLVINLDLVRTIKRASDGTTNIVFHRGPTIKIHQNYESVLAKMNLAGETFVSARAADPPDHDQPATMTAAPD